MLSWSREANVKSVEEATGHVETEMSIGVVAQQISEGVGIDWRMDMVHVWGAEMIQCEWVR